jgi:hypothetical protein
MGMKIHILKITLAILVVAFALNGCNKNNGGQNNATINQPPSMPPSLANLKKGEAYNYFSDGSCKDQNCLTKEQAMDACKAISGMTKGIRASMAPYGLTSAKREALAEGGSIDSYKFTWRDNMCFGEIILSGIYQGNSARSDVMGNTNGFVLTEGNEVLAHQIDVRGWGGD